MRTLIIIITLIISLSGMVHGQQLMKTMFWDTLKVSHSGVNLIYCDDSTFMLSCGFSKYELPYKSGRLSLQHLQEYREYIEYNTNTRSFDWFYQRTFNPKDGFIASPDRKMLIYRSRSNSCDSLYLIDVIKNEKTVIDLPDSLMLMNYSWNYVHNFVLIEGYIDETEPKDDPTNVLEIKPRRMRGPYIYLYYPESSEWKNIYSETLDFTNVYPGLNTIWHENGNSVYINYGIRDVNEEVQELILKYDLQSSILDTIYKGERIGGWMISWHQANDTSLLFKISDYTELGYWEQPISFKSFNPQTKTFTELWNRANNTHPGMVFFAMISPNRQYVAYYTYNEFVIEDITGDQPILVHKHSTDLTLYNMDADFSDDSQRVCYIRSYKTDKRYIKEDPFYYGILEFVYGEIE